MGPGIGRWVGLNVAPLDESLHERESVAQGGHGDVSMIFSALLRQRGDQVVADEFQLRRNATLGGTGGGTCLPASNSLAAASRWP